MNADAELDAALRRQAAIALDEAGLHLDRAAHRVDDATELDDRAVASALDGAAVMGGDGGIDKVAAKAPQSRKRPLLVAPGEPAVADDIGDQDRRELSGFRSLRSPGERKIYQCRCVVARSPKAAIGPGQSEERWSLLPINFSLRESVEDRS